MSASSTWHQCNVDDMLGVMQPQAAKKRGSNELMQTEEKGVDTFIGFIHDWMSEFIKILKIQVDYSEELHHDTLIRNTTLQSCLSMMNSLGFRGEQAGRSFQSKFAMLNLNLRNIVILITLSSNTPITFKKEMSPLDEPGMSNELRMRNIQQPLIFCV